jgi:hypothetical protein
LFYSADFSGSRQEDQHITSLGFQESLDGLGYLSGEFSIFERSQVACLNVKHLAFAREHWSVFQLLREGSGV